MSGPQPERFLGQGCSTPYPMSRVIGRIVWSAVQATVFRWSPRPMHAWRAWLLKLFGAEIVAPRRTVIFPTVRVTFPWRLTVEPHAMIGPRVTVYNLARVTLRYGANVSQNVHLCAGTHDFNRWSMPLVAKPIVIERNAWIGADVFIGPGVTIGELAVVGARSVVVRDLPAKKICVGHPCRPIKDRLDPAAE